MYIIAHKHALFNTHFQQNTSIYFVSMPYVCSESFKITKNIALLLKKQKKYVIMFFMKKSKGRVCYNAAWKAGSRYSGYFGTGQMLAYSYHTCSFGNECSGLSCAYGCAVSTYGL